MVATSSTEAKLLALSQTAKEAIFISRIFKAPIHRHPSTLIALRIRNKTSGILMESDEGDNH